jgi:hypothetical protein
MPPHNIADQETLNQEFRYDRLENDQERLGQSSSLAAEAVLKRPRLTLKPDRPTVCFILLAMSENGTMGADSLHHDQNKT